MEESALRRRDASHLPHACARPATRTSAPRSRAISAAARTTSPRSLPLAPNLRLVKGAYLEPPEVAYPEKSDVDAAYVRLLESSLDRHRLHGASRRTTRRSSSTRSRSRRSTRFRRERFQFQMLYGVRPALQLDLVRRGYAVLVATPYGPDWYRYLMRRLAERPANMLFLVRNLRRG